MATLPPMKAAARAVNHRWRHWVLASNNRRIFGAALVVAVVTLGVKVAALLRELLVASSLGTNDALDAYLVAFYVPNFVVTVVVDSITTALLPVYVRARDRTSDLSAQRLLAETTTISLAILGSITVAIVLACPVLLRLLAPGFGPAKLALTRELLYVLAPTVVLSGLAAVWSSILNAGERFVLPAAAPVLPPLASGVGLVVAGQRHGVYGLAAGFLIGMAAQLAIIGWGLTRERLRLAPGWHGRNPDTGDVMRQFSRVLVGAVLVGGVGLVDQAMAASLGSGAVSILSYSTKLVQPLLTIGTMALGTAVFPYFSRMVAAGDWAGVRNTLKTYVVLIVLVSIPVVAALVVFAEPVVRIVFERGAFTTADTQAVARVQAINALAIPFYSLGVLFSRLVSSMRANHIMLIVSATMLGVNALLDYVLKGLYGVPGLAMATVGHYVLTSSFMSVMLYRLLKERGTQCA